MSSENPTHKTVLVLPGGKYQIPIIKKAMARGYKVICVDRDPECEGAKWADEFYCIGLNERSKLLELVRKLNPDGIVTDQTDAGVGVTAWLSEQMNLIGIGSDAAKLFTDKHKMRQYASEHGFPTPSYSSCSDIEPALVVAKKIGYPVVVKPPSSQASKGVARANDPETLRTKFFEAQEISDSDDVVVEEFLVGPEFSIEGFVGKQKHHTLAIARKKQFNDAPMVIRSLQYVPESTKFDYDELRRVHNDLIERTGLSHSMTHAEYKFSNGQFYLIEFAARGGGAGIASEIVPWVSGVDYQIKMLDSVMGGVANIEHVKMANRCAQLEFFDFPTGHVTAINGVEAVRKLSGLLEISLNFEVGDDIHPITDGTTRLGYFILNTDTKLELEELRACVIESVSIEVS